MYIDIIHFNIKMYNMIKRIITSQIEDYLNNSSRKIFFIWGPRRSGKTTLLQYFASKLGLPVFNFDLLSDREYFIPRREILEKIVSEHTIILIDEVQNYPESTISLKILHDEFNVKIIATGSSELRQKSGEFDSLTGRFTETFCLPLSVEEIYKNMDTKLYRHQAAADIIAESFQIYGSYPEIYADAKLNQSEKIDLLQNIFNSYVLKDIINIYDLKNEKLARDILLKLALQIGSEVSLREIASSLGANTTTVANYIEIFVKNYILIPLYSFKTNMCRAVSENRKLYFYDLGIRNIVVKDFRDLYLRPDRGGVFENFIISEVDKKIKNGNKKVSMYFYREYSGKEVDLIIEDYQKKYSCFEIKVNRGKLRKNIFPLPHELKLINSLSYFDALKVL